MWRGLVDSTGTGLVGAAGGRICGRAGSDPLADFGDEGGGRTGGVEGEGVFRLFQRSELAGEERGGGEVAVTVAKTLFDLGRGSLQVDVADLRRDAEQDPIGALESGASEYGVTVVGNPSGDGCAQGRQPRLAVGIVERDSLLHLGDAGWGVERVSIGKLPAKFLGEQPADGCLSGTGDAHENEDQGSLPKGLYHRGTRCAPDGWLQPAWPQMSTD